LGILQKVETTIYDCIIDGVAPQKAILKTDTDNLWILPSHIDLVGAEIEILNVPDREYILRKILAQVKDDYDIILIDCSPSLGLITVNAMTAADSVIIPVQCEYFALEGLGKLLNTIKIIQGRLHPDLDIEGFLLTMYDSRLRLSNSVVEDVQKHFGNMVFETLITRNIKISEAPSYGQSVITYDATSKGALNYLNLAHELIKKNNLNKQNKNN
jgi:chromosome partitioning protein